MKGKRLDNYNAPMVEMKVTVLLLWQSVVQILSFNQSYRVDLGFKEKERRE